MGTKRQRVGHLSAGLGDGKVHKTVQEPDNGVDDLFNRRNTKDRNPLMRGTRTRPTFDNIEHVYPIVGDGISDKAIIPAASSWEYYVMALIAVMALIVALVLHLVTDTAPNNTRKFRRRRTLKKKKTDEYSDNDYCTDENSTVGASGYEYYYPSPSVSKGPEYPKHRKMSKENSGSSAQNRHNGFYFNPDHSGLSTYRSPTNSFYNPSRDLSPQFASPVRSLRDGSPGMSKPVKRLSPVSSFERLPIDPGYDSQSSGQNLPRPRGVARGNHSSSKISAGFDLETPKAGPRRIVSALTGTPAAAAATPNAPSLDITSGDDASPSRHMPFIPNLAAGASIPQSVSVEELHSQMETGDIQHSTATSSQTDSGAMDFARPPRQTESLQEEEDEVEAEMDENDPRMNIHHKRKNLTAATNTTKSLLSSISYDELKLEDVIGGGGFGQVWKATWRSTPVAVKLLTGSAQRTNVAKAILEEFAAEINMLKGMRHPNICLYMGACVDPPNRAIVTELAANGSLWDALRLKLGAPYKVTDGKTRAAWPLSLYPRDRQNPPHPPIGTWPWILVKRVASGAARGMTYLHSGSPAVLHRDLKSANLLLDESYTTKVCDFGLSRLKAQERSMTGNCGTVQWMAPEILANQPYAEPADVFSFGIICWELLTGDCPYDGMSAIQCALAVLNRDHRPKIPQWCPPALAALIGSCVRRDPSRRPTFAQVCEMLESMPSE